MIFNETPLKGSFLIETKSFEDKRGQFFEIWNNDLFQNAKICVPFKRTAISKNLKKGTLRGMHFQRSPCAESKIVKVLNGRIYDAIIDLNKNSPTYCKTFGVELSGQDCKALFIPQGFAHGFLTLEDNTDILYHLSHYFSAEHSAGVRWNDPHFKISWPLSPEIISEQDKSYADFAP